MSNARNLANLLSPGASTLATASIADDAITAAKIDDDGTGFKVANLEVTGNIVGNISGRFLLDASASSTDVGENILLDGTDGSATNAGSNLLFDAATEDGSIVTNNFSTTPVLLAALSNTTTIKSEGGAVTYSGQGTTNIAQGLLKGWIRFNGTSTIAINDSFNYASITDNGTGDYTATLANAMSNIFYAPTAGAGDVDYGAKIDLEHSATNTTTAMRLRTSGTNSGTGDSDLVAIHIAGDLA